MLLEGKVAIVTGGSRGIGAATSKLLASRGANVVVNYVNNKMAADEVVSAIESTGGTAVAIQADVLVPEQIGHMVEETKRVFGGRIDILVNNAGLPVAFTPFLQTTWEAFSKKIEDEMKAAYELTKAVVPTMIEQQYGRLVFVSTVLAKYPSVGSGAYGASKAALGAFAKSLAYELGEYGITSNIVSPSLIETERTSSRSPEFKKHWESITPLKRLGRPEDVAKIIAHFCSDDVEFVTGVNTMVSGGIYME